MKNNNRWIAKTLSLSMALNAFYGFSIRAEAAFLQDPRGITNAHQCSVENKSKGITVKATCGMVGGRFYRVFTDPSSGQVIEQVKSSETGPITTYKTDNMLFAKTCTVKHRETGRELSATCGQKPDATGRLTNYRMFADQGLLVEQYERDGKIETIKEKVVAKGNSSSALSDEGDSTTTTTTRRTERHTYYGDHPATNNTYNYNPHTQSSSEWSTGTKVLVVGGAILGTIGVIWGIKHAYKKGASDQHALDTEVRDTYERETEYSGRSQKSGRSSSRLSNQTKTITLGHEVPRGAGQTVTVAGEIPRSYVKTGTPVFYASGQPYVIVQNPNTNLLETLIIYDWLTSPRYYGHNYGYSFYSPYYYGAGDTIIIHDNVYVNDRSWNATPYTEEVVTTTETTTTHDSGYGSSESHESYVTQVESDVVTRSSEAEYVRVEEERSSDSSWNNSDSSSVAVEETSSTVSGDDGWSSSSNNDSSSSSSSDSSWSSSSSDSSWGSSSSSSDSSWSSSSSDSSWSSSSSDSSWSSSSSDSSW